jgi:diketogulonate reductase-like aldo/keto reductase
MLTINTVAGAPCQASRSTSMNCRFLIIYFWFLAVVTALAAATTTTPTHPGSDGSNTGPRKVGQSNATRTFTGGIGKRVLLEDGNTVPVLGLGVALSYSKTYDAVTWALEAGYRLIDTAAEESYGNEDQVGSAVRDYLASKGRSERKDQSSQQEEEEDGRHGDDDDVFITTKLWDTDHGFFQTLDAFDESYDALNGVQPGGNVRDRPVDLYLIHSPFGGRLVETWDAMLYLQRRGYVRSIGVSNFGIPHLQLLKERNRPLPVVNQIEMHPLVYRYRAELVEWCRQNKIRIQAYGSLMHGYEEWIQGTGYPPLQDIATNHNKTTAQVLLRWALQHDFLIIPKSVNHGRIVENSLLYDFELSVHEMQQLDDWGVLVAEGADGDVRNLYEEDFEWNPIDEAPAHRGRTGYWESNFAGVDEVYFGADDVLDDDDDDDDHVHDDNDISVRMQQRETKETSDGEL